MRPNPLRQRFEAGDRALGAWLSMPSSVSAEAVAANDFDYICIDMQHGLVHYADLVPMLQAITLGTATPTVRVPQNEPAFIGKALDAGAMAVIVPMVNSVEECEEAVQAARYAPEGSRSFGPTRAKAVEGTNYWSDANTSVMCIPMIETVEAIDAIDDILAVTGVETIYVGPADLAISMGFPPGSNEPDYLAALDSIVAACRRHNVVPGIHATTATAPDRFARGFRMVTVTADLLALRAKVADDLDLMRRGIKGADTAIY